LSSRSAASPGPRTSSACAEAGADLVGCIFAAKSPRRVTPAQAAALPRSAARRVGVFVEQTVPEILAIMDEAALDLAQLHGDHTPEDCRAIGPERVIRTFWPNRYPDLPGLAAAMAAYAGAVRYALLDAGSAGGGHGRTLDWAALAGLDAPMPWLLAGGLGPDNVAEAVAAAQAARRGPQLRRGSIAGPQGVGQSPEVSLGPERVGRREKKRKNQGPALDPPGGLLPPGPPRRGSGKAPPYID